MRKLGLKKSNIDLHAPRLGALPYATQKAPDRVLNRPDANAQMFLNDTLSDCTAAGIGNSLLAVSALQGWKLDLRDSDALAFYEGSAGYTPSNPLSDDGCTGPTALNYAVNKGFGSADGTYYGVWGNVDSDDRNGIANTIAELGVCAIGVELAISDMNQVDDNEHCIWTKNNFLHGDTTPGSAGGHFLLAYEYDGLGDDDVVTLITWGSQKTRCTWGWLSNRIVEAHGIIWPQLKRADGKYCGSQFDALIEEAKHYAAK